MISYAQNFEDVLLWRALHDVAGGYYVDVGAFHPEIDSVTKWFYDQGWSGINIEPVPQVFALLEGARPRDQNVRAAAGAASGTAQLYVPRNSPGLSSLSPTSAEANDPSSVELLTVEVCTLNQVLDPHGDKPINFLKIDAEGEERNVLLGIDFSRFRPWIVIIEATAPQSSRRTSQEWDEILLTHDYYKVYFDGLNEYYLSAEKKEIADQFSVPPNVFDNFELAVTIREQEANKNLQIVCDSIRAELGMRTKELEQAHEAYSTLQQSYAALDQSYAALDHQRCQEIASRDLAFTKMSEDLAELSNALRSSREQLQMVLNSRSWRWLAPVRRCRAVLFPKRKV